MNKIDKLKLNLIKEKLQLARATKEQGADSKGIKAWKKKLNSEENIVKAEEKKDKFEKEIKAKSLLSRISKQADKVNSKMSKFVGKSLDSKSSNKKVLRDKQKVTVVVNQPVYSRDKSRYFKTAWEEERRQLYFK
jgi:hypothetical protein